MQIALAQFEVERGLPQVNLEKIRGFAVEAATAGAQALFLPEMCTTGFHWKRNRELLPEAGQLTDAVAALASELGIAISGSFLEQTEVGGMANTLMYWNASGERLAHYRKVHLFTLFREERHVEAGTELVTADTEIGKLGCSVCYDLRFPELFRTCALDGVELQLLPAAFPHPRLEHWRTLIRARAIENQNYFIAVNQCGSEGHGDGVGDVVYFGHSAVIDPWGNTVVEAGEDEGLFFAEIDPALVTKTRKQLPALQDRKPDLY